MKSNKRRQKHEQMARTIRGEAFSAGCADMSDAMDFLQS
jgi:hypothetical protein